jgi:hypothetical protein
LIESIQNSNGEGINQKGPNGRSLREIDQNARDLNRIDQNARDLNRIDQNANLRGLIRKFNDGRQRENALDVLGGQIGKETIELRIVLG